MEKLKLHNVRKIFQARRGKVIAVDNASTTIAAGSIVALLGPNGAGKTTLLDMVLGLSKPTAGTIAIDGTSPANALSTAGIGALLQTGGLLNSMTVAQTLHYIAAAYRSAIIITDERLDKVVAQTGLAPLLKRKIGKLSGGEQQRVKFALALLPDPSLLILDEPTTGMDVNSRRAFWNTMRAETNTGKTIIFATHYLHEAEEFADRIILMNRGRIIADAPTDEIRSIAGVRHVRATVGRADPKHLARLQASFPATVTNGKITCSTAKSDELAQQLLAVGASGLEITPSSLDEALTSLIAADTTPATNAAMTAGVAIPDIDTTEKEGA